MAMATFSVSVGTYGDMASAWRQASWSRSSRPLRSARGSSPPPLPEALRSALWPVMPQAA